MKIIVNNVAKPIKINSKNTYIMTYKIIVMKLIMEIIDTILNPSHTNHIKTQQKNTSNKID